MKININKRERLLWIMVVLPACVFFLVLAQVENCMIITPYQDDSDVIMPSDDKAIPPDFRKFCQICKNKA
jgi:hypothetical protein